MPYCWYKVKTYYAFVKLRFIIIYWNLSKNSHSLDLWSNKSNQCLKKYFIVYYYYCYYRQINGLDNVQTLQLSRNWKKISRKKKKWNSLFSQFLGLSQKIPRLSKTPFSGVYYDDHFIWRCLHCNWWLWGWIKSRTVGIVNILAMKRTFVSHAWLPHPVLWGVS